MRHLRHGIWLLAFLAGAGLAQAETLGWQESVARLAGDRTIAETCARLLKRHGDAVAVSRGELTYGDAKADVDAVIAGLVVALAQDDAPASLPDLEARLRRGVQGRDTFCAGVTPLVPDATGEKNLIIDLLGEALAPLIEAVQAIYIDAQEEDRLTRRTIQTQLKATSWPAFAAIQP